MPNKYGGYKYNMLSDLLYVHDEAVTCGATYSTLEVYDKRHLGTIKIYPFLAETFSEWRGCPLNRKINHRIMISDFFFFVFAAIFLVLFPRAMELFIELHFLCTA